MYRVKVEGKGFNVLEFTFSSMEEVDVFVGTCFATCDNEIEVTITKKEDSKDA